MLNKISIIFQDNKSIIYGIIVSTIIVLITAYNMIHTVNDNLIFMHRLTPVKIEVLNDKEHRVYYVHRKSDNIVRYQFYNISSINKELIEHVANAILTGKEIIMYRDKSISNNENSLLINRIETVNNNK